MDRAHRTVSIRLRATCALVASVTAGLMLMSAGSAAASLALTGNGTFDTGRIEKSDRDESPVELAGRGGADERRPPARGSSAELYGGSSADRYGGSSADRRGVAGARDPRLHRPRDRDRDSPRQKDPDREGEEREEGEEHESE